MANSRVVDILMEQGRQAAAARMAQGQIWGNAVQQLSQIPGQMVQQAAQAKQQGIENKDREARLGLDTEHLKMLQGDRTTQAAERAKQAAGDVATTKAIAAHTTVDPTTGIHTTDHNGVVQDLLDQNFQGHAEHYMAFAPKQQEMNNQIQHDSLALEASKNAYRLNVIGDIPDAPADQRADLYTKRIATLPELAKQDDKLGKLPPVYPGDQALSGMVESWRTDADRTARQKTAATEKLAAAKEAESERKAATTEAETSQYHREESAARGATAAYQRGELANAAAGRAETARHNRAEEHLGQERVDVGPTGTAAMGDVKEAVTAMKEGKAPPMLPGRATKEYLATIAEARRQGFDIASAATDWTATQKHIATMNGAQQLRLSQAINTLPDMLDKVDTLASKWKGGRFPILNSANLKAAKAGVYGQDVASVANQLDAQIADVTADLGNVYMGGNSPTDHALGLAGKSLSGEWSEKVLHDMTNLARDNVKVRKNSIANTGVAGASATNPYGNQPPAPAAAPNRIYYDAQGNPIQK